ncbi:MAG: Arm DNA-binding domain-containing protein [Pseudomonadota bacterium]
MWYKGGRQMVSGKLTKRFVESAGAGRHGDGNGLYLVVDPSGARRWIVRVTVKGQRNRKGGPLRTDLGLGGADVVTRKGAGVQAFRKAGAEPALQCGEGRSHIRRSRSTSPHRAASHMEERQARPAIDQHAAKQRLSQDRTPASIQHWPTGNPILPLPDLDREA